MNRRLQKVTFKKADLPYSYDLKHSVILAPIGVFLLISFLNKSPVEIHFHPKCSARNKAFSYLNEPGGPIKNTLVTEKYQRYKFTYQALFEVLLSNNQEANQVYS